MIWTKLFAFGDSLSDTGAGYVDGNGPTAIAYAARELGIPFTHARDPERGDRGLNYAVSGAQTGESAAEYVKGTLLGYGMLYQVRDFETEVSTGGIRFDPARTLFFVGGGLNDGKLASEVTAANFTQIFRRLHEVGGRYFCLGDLPEGIPEYAATAKRLNPVIGKLPESLRKDLPEARIRLCGWGSRFDAILRDPTPYGIRNTTDRCAGRALFDEDPTPCGDPERYYYYHEAHPSTKVHQHVGKSLAAEFRTILR